MGGSVEGASEQEFLEGENRVVCLILSDKVDDVARARVLGGFLCCWYFEFDLLGEQKPGRDWQRGGG